MDPLRLLYVIDSLAPGGAETSLLEMAPGLLTDGIDLHVLPLGRRMDLAGPLQSVGATVHRHGRSGGRPANVRGVLDLARELEPHLVHTTLFEADVAGRVAARLAGVPTSSSIVGETYGAARRAEVGRYRLAAAQMTDRWSSRFARRLHAVSESLALQAARSLAFPRHRIDVVPRGRNPAKFIYQPSGVRARVRTSLGVPPDAPMILAVGRQEPAKGLIHLIDAGGLVAARLPGMVIALAGAEGRSSEALRRAAAAARLDVRFLGHRDDVADLLAAADVLCFPSEREGSPGTLIEAMAVGCPIVASDIAPITELVADQDGPVAALGSASDHVWLSEAILACFSEPAQARSRTVRARRHFEEHYSIDRISSLMAAFFRRSARE